MICNRWLEFFCHNQCPSLICLFENLLMGCVVSILFRMPHKSSYILHSPFFKFLGRVLEHFQCICTRRPPLRARDCSTSLANFLSHKININAQSFAQVFMYFFGLSSFPFFFSFSIFPFFCFDFLFNWISENGAATVVLVLLFSLFNAHAGGLFFTFSFLLIFHCKSY